MKYVGYYRGIETTNVCWFIVESLEEEVALDKNLRERGYSKSNLERPFTYTEVDDDDDDEEDNCPCCGNIIE